MKKQDFLVTFLSLMATPMIVTAMLIYDIRILCAFLLVCPCVHIKATLMVLFCMIIKIYDIIGGS